MRARLRRGRSEANVGYTIIEVHFPSIGARLPKKRAYLVGAAPPFLTTNYALFQDGLPFSAGTAYQLGPRRAIDRRQPKSGPSSRRAN